MTQGQENQAKDMQNQAKDMQNYAKEVQNQAREVTELKRQVGQMAEFMGQFSREQGKLPSATNVNPKGGFESAKAITLRSGKEVGIESDTPKSTQKEDEKLQEEEGSTSMSTARVKNPLPQAPTNHPNSAKQGKIASSSVNTNLPDVPFPRRFMQSKKDENEKDILETFRKVQVNIPLLDAIKQIPKYAKFLKKLCTTRKRIREKEVVQVSENVSAVLQRKLPPKCKDPGSFTIPCVIGHTKFEHAMLDLGASINVMPYSVYASMNLGELKKDGVVIQLADRSNAYPKGVLEDVFVQVDHLIFPADFYVLDMEETAHSPSPPLLLGRPFMKTANTKIDVAKGAVTMQFGGDMINFKISESVEHINDVHSCCAINVIKDIRQECSSLIKQNGFQPTKEEGIGVGNSVTTLKKPNLAENNHCAILDKSATSMQYMGKSPIPKSIPISTNRLLPSLVQGLNQTKGGEKVHLDVRKQNTKNRKDHYPLPFKDSMPRRFKKYVVKAIPFHAVGTNGA